jgi:hypothetical protein
MRGGEVLKPLEPSEEGICDELTVIGVAITKFEDGWDLPPGVKDEPHEEEGEECDLDCDEERMLEARFEDLGEGEEWPSDPEDEEGDEMKELG